MSLLYQQVLAADIEGLVIRKLKSFLTSPDSITTELGADNDDAIQRTTQAAKQLAILRRKQLSKAISEANEKLRQLRRRSKLYRQEVKFARELNKEARDIDKRIVGLTKQLSSAQESRQRRAHELLLRSIRLHPEKLSSGFGSEPSISSTTQVKLPLSYLRTWPLLRRAVPCR